MDLRLAYNSGAAFSAGADAPAALVLTVTAVITTAVAVVAWRAAPRGSSQEEPPKGTTASHVG